jgi:hypothetical protein
MKTFSITFRAGGKVHKAKVVKCSSIPIKYKVSGVIPLNRKLPTSFTFISNPDFDQLICYSFNERNREILTIIGEAIFKTCQLKKMPVHQ